MLTKIARLMHAILFISLGIMFLGQLILDMTIISHYLQLLCLFATVISMYFFEDLVVKYRTKVVLEQMLGNNMFDRNKDKYTVSISRKRIGQ